MEEDACKLSNLPSRIKQIRTYFCDGDNMKFAEKLGKSKAYTSSLCNGKESTGKKIVEDILATFPQVSRSWLVLGEGAMLVSPTPSGDTVVNAASAGEVNTISHTGNGSSNSIHTGASNDELLKMYEARIADKDDMIASLKQRCELQQEYIRMLSDEHRALIHKIMGYTQDNNEILTEIKNGQIGFKLGKDGEIIPAETKEK